MWAEQNNKIADNQSEEKMSEKQNENVITINGKDFKKDELDARQAYLIDQIRDLQGKADGLRFNLDQVVTASNQFTTELLDSLQFDEAEVSNG